MRRERTMEIFDYFQNWKVKRLQQLALPEPQRNLPLFCPPKPTQATGMRLNLKVCKEVFD